ncbi:uncharacterized protein LOC117815937 [Notolabrus celidotus]|uniref:uncharacterized protein LOC117815937 n=1 Tax=Notolabrus celidotus TaxID=1203425 RepID=UPI00148FBEBF|nr:uncharacterized protein LOC117815937 [Notolabrus celidotus]
MVFRLVDLTCSSDANPAATYTWYKENDDEPLHNGAKLVFLTDFSVSDELYCTAENELGRKRSKHFSVDGKLVRGEDDWGVTYSSYQICALKGSTVDIPCTYTYPSTINNQTTKVQDRLWFAKMSSSTPVDLKTDSDYSGRVEYHFNENDCTLRIKDLRESDSAQYKFRFTANQQGGRFTGEPGVTLTVTDLQVEVESVSTQAELRCHSSCNVADSRSYVWYRNGQKQAAETSSLRVPVPDFNSYACAVKGHEEHHSAAVYAPKTPSVSQSPTDFSGSGDFYCTAENKLGRKRSEHLSVDAKWNSTFNMNIMKLTLMLLMMTPLLVLTLWMRKKKTLSSTTKPNEPVEMIELDSGSEYENVLAVPAAQTEDAEEQEDLV